MDCFYSNCEFVFKGSHLPFDVKNGVMANPEMI